MTAPGSEPAQPQPAPAQPREPRDPRSMLRLAVLVYIVENLGYGIPMLIWPDLLWGTVAGAEGAALDALTSNRWAGGVLTAVGIGGIMVFTHLRGQRTFVTTMALQLTIAGAAIVVSNIAGEFDIVDAWFRWLSAIVVVLGAIYMWVARWRAREILAV